MYRTINDNARFFEIGVEKQVYARTPRKAKADYTFSCMMCKKESCAEGRCSIRIAHDVAMNRLHEKANKFFNNGTLAQQRSRDYTEATKQFTNSCERCKNALYGVYQKCEDCPIKNSYTKNIQNFVK